MTTVRAALAGWVALLLLGLLAPLSLGVGGASVSFWLVPLIAVHLWPRAARMDASAALVFATGVALDYALGLRLGTMGLVLLGWMLVARPDLREDEAMGELRLMASFVAGLLVVTVAMALLWRDGGVLAALWPDALAAAILFPLVLRLLRLGGRRDLRAGLA